MELSSAAEVEAVLRCACHPYWDGVVPVSSPLLWLRSGGPPQAAQSSPQPGLPPVVPGTALSPAAVCQEIADCSTVSAGSVQTLRMPASSFSEICHLSLWSCMVQ